MFLDLQSIRDDEATTSKELIFFNTLTDVPITSRKTRFENANSGKTMTFYKSIRAFSENIRKLPFDHSNYRLFERIPAVPGTSNNRGLTVAAKYQIAPSKAVVGVDRPIKALSCIYKSHISEKLSKFSRLSFCQKIFVPNQTPSCICSMCLY